MSFKKTFKKNEKKSRIGGAEKKRGNEGREENN
jgi:hypothetical protein